MEDKIEKLRFLIDNISDEKNFDESLEILHQLRVAYKKK